MIQRVGVIGGGQLAQMLGFSAQELGIDLFVQTPHTTDPAFAAATGAILAPLDDLDATRDLAARSDVITFENEFVDLKQLWTLREQGVQFRPDLTALEPLLDKQDQRQFLHHLQLPIPQYIPLEGTVELDKLSDQISFPAMLKARRHGYDGQGTQVIQTQTELQNKVAKQADTLWLLEEWIPFERELAVVAARSASGEISIFPVVETQQEHQICRRVLIPAEISEITCQQIQAMVKQILTQLQVIGVFGIELFAVADQVLINEISPRIHNSGHYTMEACGVSQFEQHLRAICNLPLKDPQLTYGSAVMVNLLGLEGEDKYLEKQDRLEQFPGAHLHWYGKSESRPGRKLGHVTVCFEETRDRQGLLEVAAELEGIWYGEERH